MSVERFLTEAQARCDAAMIAPFNLDEDAFLAAARTDLPRALAVIRVLRAAVVYAQIRAGALSDHQLWGTLQKELDTADALARGEEGSHGR